MDLQNARVVITGASRGIGAAIADELSKAGAELTLLARSEDALAEVAERTNAVLRKAVLGAELVFLNCPHPSGPAI